MSSDPYGINQVKTEQKTDEKCPNCAATLRFEPTTGLITCDYCGYTRSVVPAEGQDGAGGFAQEQVLSDAENAESNFNWGESTKTVLCNSCGASSVYDSLIAASSCPYCGSNQVLEIPAEDTVPPGGVCPFTIDKATAVERFKAWIKKKIFAPSEAKKAAKAENAVGIFLPYWTFDTKTFSNYTARAGRTTTVGSGKNARTVTHWFSVSGSHYQAFDDQLICASTRHDRKQLQRIEPYDSNHAMVYDPQYLSGFVAERYSIGLAKGWEMGKQEINAKLRAEITTEIRRNHRADKVASLQFSTIYDSATYKYVLLPMWSACYKYRDKVYNFFVNGQTGKTAGTYPKSPIRIAIAVLLAILVVGLLYYFYQQ